MWIFRILKSYAGLLYIHLRTAQNLQCIASIGLIAVLVAETIAHYFPKLVELHNYPPATGTKLKIENWSVLNRWVVVFSFAIGCWYFLLSSYLTHRHWHMQSFQYIFASKYKFQLAVKPSIFFDAFGVIQKIRRCFVEKYSKSCILS